MQFGNGSPLGRDYKIEEVTARILASTDAPREGWALRSEMYAAKVAAESIFAEPYRSPDLGDTALVLQCINCARPVRPSEAPVLRETFIRLYGQQIFEMVA